MWLSGSNRRPASHHREVAEINTRYFALAGLILLALVFQSAFFLRVGFSVQPDLLLIMVLSFALLRGTTFGSMMGLSIGLVQDLLAGGFIGLNALTKALAGFLVGLVQKNIFHDSWLVPSLTVFIGTIINQCVSLLILHSFDQRFALFPPLFVRLLPLAFFNALLTPVIYHVISGTERYFAAQRLGTLHSRHFE